MAEILYQDFLMDEEAYDQAVAYWAAFFDSLLEEYDYTREPYLNQTFVDGTVLRDGNPIFHAYLPEIDRAVRIIQEEPEEPADIASWTNETEWPDGRPLEELVVALVLTEETKAEAEARIRKWLEGEEE